MWIRKCHQKLQKMTLTAHSTLQGFKKCNCKFVNYGVFPSFKTFNPYNLKSDDP